MKALLAVALLVLAIPLASETRTAATGATTRLATPLVVEDSAAPYRTALGYQALASNDNTMGYYNTASGFQALYYTTTGYGNVASGYAALYSNTTGAANTASGGGALYNTAGANNTAFGTSAGFNATTGVYNVFLGANVGSQEPCRMARGNHHRPGWL